VVAAGRARGRRGPDWAGWAELPGDMGQFQREVAHATRRNGLQKPFLDLNQGFIYF
jgi:hypothetical protein